MTARFRPHFALSLGLFLSLPALAPAEMRKWTNSSGKSIEAEMTAVDVAARTITIKKADGQSFTIPIDTLSAADKAFAAEEWKKMQAMPAATTPAAPAPGAPAAPAVPAAPAPAPAAAAPGKPAPAHPGIAVLPAAKFKVPNNADYLVKVLKTRPRIIHGAPGWAALKAQATTDPTLTKMVANLKAGAEKLLEAPELTRIFGEQRSTVTPGSKAMFRMATLGTLHQLDGDPRWMERGVREMIAITDPATFQNWYVDEPSVTADFLIAAAIGYDHFKAGMTEKQVLDCRTYMVEKGIGALEAFMKGEQPPESAKGKAAGTADTKKAAPKAAPKKPAEPEDPDAEHMAAASALILAGICLIEDDPSAAKAAIDAGGKPFGKGMLRFAPAGIWPEGMEAGEQVLDYAIMVMQTLKANAGSDFGFSQLEGMYQAGLARIHLVGATGQLFNYGDAAGTALTRPWVSTWLAGVHGNLGTKALTAGAAPGADTAFLNLAGQIMYFNPYAAGDGTPSSTDYGVPGGQIAALRSSWDKGAYYVALKGGDNGIKTAQMDLGTFVLEAAGKRWGIELGADGDRAPGFNPDAPDRTARYKLYVEGTGGQNTLQMGEPATDAKTKKPELNVNQEFDAKAMVVAAHSSPALGIAAVDLGKAYSKAAKDAVRGALMVRGAKPYVVVQDDLMIKNTTTVTWSMHTRAEVTVDGKTATLTDKEQKLHAVLLSPEGATFATEDAPESENDQIKKLTGIKVLKVKLLEVKGPQTISIAFAVGEPPPAHPVKPIAEWVPKK